MNQGVHQGQYTGAGAGTYGRPGPTAPQAPQAPQTPQTPQASPVPQTPQPAGVPPQYQVVQQVSEDPSATVYLCRSLPDGGGDLALKVFHLPVHDERRRLDVHSGLLAAGAATRHPCALEVVDAGFTPDHRPYMVTPFCPGGTAEARMASGGLPVEEVLVTGVRLALALHASHRSGVLHLDVRPGNVVYDAQGNALLTGHGITRILQRCVPGAGAIFDPMFAAREHFGWEKPAPATDVHALGATLYGLLTGAPPYAAAAQRGWAALYEEIFRGELPRPRQPLPPGLFELLERMVSAHPENRPPLTEVHRFLRDLVPHSARHRVPDLEPEPDRVLPLPGWTPADEAAIAALERRDGDGV